MMKRMACLLLLSAFTGFVSLAETQQPESPLPPPLDKKNERTFTTTRLWRPASRIPDGGHPVYFSDRKSMWGPDAGTIHFKLDAESKRAVTLPIDWAKNLAFPMYLNDQYGDCYYAAGCHADNTTTGNASTKSEFSLGAIRSRYLSLSGGDNGLTDSDMQGEMMNRYLADVPAAKIVSWAYIDPTDAVATQIAMQKFGPIMFTFAVAPNWISHSDAGDIWDVSSYRPNNNGHAVIFNGVDTRGYYKLQTWGTYVWITPAAVKVCDPGAWVTFSPRWFNASGYAPNGMHITELAKDWKAATGKTISDAVITAFPPPGPTPPQPPNPPLPPSPPNPPPAPIPGAAGTITWTVNGVTQQYELFPLGSRDKLRELVGPLNP